MIGQKGVPATHGGVERHVDELGARLVGLGHEVTVFTRPNYTDPALREHRGMRLVSLPTIGTKHLDAIVHSVLATLVCWRGGYEVVHYHAIGPCLASPLARLRGRHVVATIHGADWRRSKWGRGARSVLRLGEWMALHVPHVTISVSETLAQRYAEETGRRVVYIPNGIAIDPGDDTAVLDEFGLTDRGYVLFAGRLVPEKGAHYLLEAQSCAHTEMPVVIAGDQSMSEDYVAVLRALAGDDVVFTGYQYGARLAALFRHAALFVLPSDLEGLPIVLLEALAYGLPVLASDIAPNVEVLGDKGRYFRAGDVSSLATELAQCVREAPEMRESVQEFQLQALATYDWNKVGRETAGLYESLVSR
jgi:glycosyltransferase involved in cell wall biosynthesis